MKRVFTDPNFMRCNVVRGYLESVGIQAIIENEPGNDGPVRTTVGPRNFADDSSWPQVLVADDRYEEAIAIIDTFG